MADFAALDDAEFEAQAGEVRALLGENGAGKSSLMNVAAGLYTPEAGQIFVNGEEVVFSGPRDATARGIGMVHQEFKLVQPFTVVENVLLANWSGRFAPGVREIQRQIQTQAAMLGFDIDPKSRVDELSIAERQRVEIVKVLLAGARILILDEPTAVLTDEEAVRLLTTVRALASSGAAVILVTHKLGEVTSFTDRVTVMRGGRAVAHLDSRATDATELTRLAVGTTVASPHRASSSVPGEARITIKGLRAARADGHLTVNDASFHVCAGEIYGIAGVGGNGQTELVEALTGVRAPIGGTIEIEGAGNATGASPERLRDLGIACIPADRFGFGVAGGLSVVDNFCVGQIAEALMARGCAPTGRPCARRPPRPSANLTCRACAHCGNARLSSLAATPRSSSSLASSPATRRSSSRIVQAVASTFAPVRQCRNAYSEHAPAAWPSY